MLTKIISVLKQQFNYNEKIINFKDNASEKAEIKIFY